MNPLTTLLFWAPLAFGFLVAASYTGTMIALKRYHENAAFSASDVIRVEDGDDDHRENDG